ncbi:hypothetical protein, partial [Salmonella enterica]|uniref:hypothetical protein n=1 Tax=Salmonella enterica TaxID=28901 RepID=UPI0020C50113
IAYMTPEERQTALYYAQHGDYEKMRAYIDNVSRDANARRVAAQNQLLYNYSEKHPGAAVVMHAAAGFGNIGAFAESGRQALENAITGEYAP